MLAFLGLEATKWLTKLSHLRASPRSLYPTSSHTPSPPPKKKPGDEFALYLHAVLALGNRIYDTETNQHQEYGSLSVSCLFNTSAECPDSRWGIKFSRSLPSPPIPGTWISSRDMRNVAWLFMHVWYYWWNQSGCLILALLVVTW